MFNLRPFQVNPKAAYIRRRKKKKILKKKCCKYMMGFCFHWCTLAKSTKIKPLYILNDLEN